MHKSKIKQISLAVCLAFMPLHGVAAGLGKLNVNSGLGEPLKAEVELLSVTPEELSSLTATIASEEAYTTQGISRLGIHSNIRVELSKSIDGSPVLVLRSSLPITDPYLDMLIQVDWSSGRLLREYTVLLDPPGYKETVNQTPQSVITTQPATVKSSVSDRASQDVKQTKKAKKVTSQAETSTEAGQLITVSGDTLNSLAKELQVEGVSLDQMLVGLFEANQQAFANGNMNRLKVGQIIKAPDREALEAIDPQRAKQTIKAHSANWNEYRNALAGTVAASSASVDSEPKQTASGKISSAEDKAVPPKVGTQDVVKLSAGAKTEAPTASVSDDFDAKVLALQEEATAREKALKEALDRTAALEKQIEDMQKLLALKNQSMTDLQSNAASQSERVEAKEGQAIPAKPVKKPTKAKVTPVEQVQVEEPSFLEDLLGGNIVLLGGAAGIGLLGAGWMYLRNKRRKDLDSFERGILTSGGLRANTVFGNTTGNASTSDTSFLTDFAQSADGSMIDTNDVDPIAEAEVYMAYGRDAQAEEILKDAIVKEPKRYELHLKLLEMYASRKDTSAFETIAGELYTTLGTDDPVWAKVVELGVSVEPENPLYDTSKLNSVTLPAGVKEDSLDFAVPTVADDALDFSLGDESESKAEATEGDAGSAIMQSFADAEQNSVQDLTLDLGSTDEAPGLSDTQAEVAVQEPDLAAEEVASDQSNMLDFDMNQSADESVVATASVEDSNLTDLAAEDITSSVAASSEDSAEIADNTLDFELPVISPVLETTSEHVDALPSVEFEMTAEDDGSQAVALDFSPSEALVDEESTKAEDFNLEFNLPAIELSADTEPEIEAEVVAEAEPALDMSALSGISLDLDASEPASAVDEAEEITLESPVLADAVPETVPSQTDGPFDFSAISLDLGDADQMSEEQLVDGGGIDLAEPVVSENQDVDVKLDLVAAYIDMDDKEGARELLDEVIKEGGPQQRQRAEQLLASLA